MSAKNQSSSKTNLWATASKEWVIEPKPKPGRKPKKDTYSPSKSDIEQGEAKGRRVQNRAAQRAFRERKQSQISELQARIQSYEQGEIERNIALQNIAKHLKEENERLRHENELLEKRILQLRPTSDISQPIKQNSMDKKRWRDDCLSSMQGSAEKKPRKKSDYCTSIVNVPTLHLPSPSSPLVSTPKSYETPNSNFLPLSRDLHDTLDPSQFNGFGDISTGMKDTEETMHPFPPFGCGFCDEGTICVCHEVTAQQVDVTNDFKSNGLRDNQLTLTEDNDTHPQSSTETARSSILDNLPAYQPPVAIRRRARGISVNSVFPIETAPDSSVALGADCSGDPSNCLACGDDPFGKAFCAAIGNSTMQTVCDNCPGQMSNASSVFGRSCCGSNASGCTFMPTNDAWRKLKEHPNVEFADLSLLAEVVSSRFQCLGSQVLISTETRNHQESNSVIEHILEGRGATTSPRRLVPEEILLECGRRRRRKVHADGVRDALRMLDAKFS